MLLVRKLKEMLILPIAMETEDESQPFKYVQGMNVLSAPFLFTMPSQLEAFQCFSTFIENGCPLYVQPSLKGVHKGLTVRSYTCY